MIKFKLLTEDTDDMQADVLVSMLKAYGINAKKEYDGPTAVAKLYVGTAVTGVKIMVEESQLEEARDILNAEPVFPDDLSDTL